MGAAIGALAGTDGNTGNIIGGVLVGAAAGAGEQAWKTRKERKEIVIRCMQQRGHRAVG